MGENNVEYGCETVGNTLVLSVSVMSQGNQQESRFRKYFRKYEGFVNVIGGIFGAGFSAFVGSIISTQTLGITQTFGGQIQLQLALALLMFGYYVGISFAKGTDYAQFLTGFLAGALSIGLWFSRESLTNYYFGVGAAMSVGFGLYFGSRRPIFNRARLDKLIRTLVNGGGWTIQISGTIASVSTTLKIDAATTIVLLVIILGGWFVFAGYKYIKKYWNEGF